MTSLEDTLARPEFASVDLGIDTDEAHTYIDETMKGLSASESAEGRRYRTTDGMLIVVLGERRSDEGETQTTLAYRTEPASEQATRKAKKIFRALEPHVVGE